MFTEYIDTAMKKAKYEKLEDDEGYFATIPGFKGLWASARTVRESRKELRLVLEDWILIKLHHNDGDLPIIGGMNLNAPKRQKSRVA
jgi:hypothetical protein